MTRYTKHRFLGRPFTALLILLFAFCLVGGNGLHAQSDNAETSKIYANLNAGFGLLYGGLGGNLEIGTGHFSGFGSFGYATPRSFDTIRIAPTYNYMFGLRYYFNVNSNVLFPRVGLGYGWITNYYNDKIGNASYDQTVHGLSLHLGAQFYTLEGLVFNFDVGIASKVAITNPSSHPHFYSLYVRPNIGIGYDLTHLFNKGGKSDHIKNKDIDPFGGN